MRWTTWLIMAAPKFEIPLTLKQMAKCGFAQISHSDARPFFIVQSARQKGFVSGQCSIWSCKFCLMTCFVSVYAIESIKLIQFFFELHFWVKKRISWMIGEKKIFNLEKTVFDDNQAKNCGLVWDKPVPAIWLSSCPIFMSFCWIFLFALREIIF